MSVKFKIYALIGFTVAAFLLWQHYNWMSERLAEKTREALSWQGLYLGAEKNRRFEAGEAKRLAEETKALQDRINLIKPEIKTVKEYVTIYRDNPTVMRCDLPIEWVHLHDRAVRLSEDRGAAIGVPGTSRESVPDHQVLDTVVDNYEKYHILTERYKSLLSSCNGIIARYNAEIESRKNDIIKGR